MNELDLPGRQLETNHTGDPTYDRAIELITATRIPFDKLVANWFDELPTIGQYPEKEWKAILVRVKSANAMLPRVEDLIYQDILLKREAGETKVDLKGYLMSEEHPINLGVSCREYQIAASHVIFRILAEGLSDCPKEERDYTDLIYFGAIHDLLVGVKTSKSYFVAFAYSGEIDPRLIEEINISVVSADEEEVFSAQMKVLLEGGGATPLKRAGGETYSVLSFKPDSEKERE